MSRSERRTSRRKVRLTAFLLAAAALAGVLRQLWSTFWRERPLATTSPMRARAEVERPASVGPAAPVAERAPAPGPGRRPERTPAHEQRAVRSLDGGSVAPDDVVAPPEPARPDDASTSRTPTLEVRR